MPILDRIVAHRGAAAPVLAAVFAIGAGFASPARAHDPAAADGLARAERAFAAASVASGMKAAFLDALADDATLFRPGPVNGKAFIAARPDGPFVLDWAPTRVAVAASGELGWSSGPWRLVPRATPDRPTHGEFFSVWKRDPSGRWRVLIDHGIAYEESVAPSTFAVVGTGHGATPSITIAAAEAAFARRSESDGIAAAYREAVSNRARLLRDDRPPIDGRDALADLPDAAASWRWSVSDSGTAGSGDLAWTTGRYRASATTGYFVRVWQAEGGAWKILADVLAPVADGPQ